ncbi:MAG: carbohydrate binding family 9 domain-containing protein [Chitinophagales bacterium]|nr:carbohydrate binding family 9 domain-containing protein [Chitinophagales bacterium]
MQKILLLTLSIYFSSIIFAQQLPPYIPLRIYEKISLDGRLSEPVWQQAEVINDFMQYDPFPGQQPYALTELRIMYDDDFMYVAYSCFDPEPDKMIALSLERDFEIGRDDGIAFIIDTYNDKSTGLAFITNTLGARWDMEFSSDGTTENDSYNTFWDVTSYSDSTGYYSEFRIPFSSMRFKSDSMVTMGIRAIRLIKRLNEYSIYPPCPPDIDNAFWKVSLAREMQLTNLKGAKPFYIIPYVTAGYGEIQQLNNDGTAYQKETEFMKRNYYSDNEVVDKILSNIGGDIKYGISKNLTLDLTVNTDFAQAEADNVIINLSKYEVNLPEKRGFFLESKNYFSFGTSSGDQLFISRSIGQDDGEIIPLIGGARVTGKVGNFQFGALNMQTGSANDGETPSSNFTVFRNRVFFDSLGSFWGGIITNKINVGESPATFQSLGIGGVKYINSRLSIISAISGTYENMDLAAFANRVYYNFGINRNVRQGWNLGFDASLIGKDFVPEMGYIAENDLLNTGLKVGYIWRPESATISSYNIYTFSRYRYKPTLQQNETEFFSAEGSLYFKNGLGIQLKPLEINNDLLFYDWNINNDITIPQNTYFMYSPDLNIEAPSDGDYSGNVFMKFGDFYGGNRFSLYPSVDYFITKNLQIGIDYEYNHIQFPTEFASGDNNALFISNLIRLNISCYFSSKISIKLFTQYDDISDKVSSNLRFRYNPVEGTDLYVVFNQDLNTDPLNMMPELPVVNNQGITVKFVKTFTVK